MIRAPLIALLAFACGGEPPVSTGSAGERSVEAAPAEPSQEAATTTAEADPPAADQPAEAERAPEPLDFEAAFPEEPCADTDVLAAHSQLDLPPHLTHAIALRSDDGRRVTVAISDAPITRDALGRFEPPGEGHARLEFDAIRRRRSGALEPGTLGLPDSRRQALTHARVVRAEDSVTFGVRNIGHVQLTEADEARVCGRVDLSDGFAQLRGPFTAEVITVE